VSGGPFKNAVAFLNPSGKKVVLFANETEKSVAVEIEVGNSRAALDVPAQSMNTVILGDN
jgi:O-glycosyl hydrolase